MSIARKKYREENREKQLEINKKHYAKYREANKEKISERHKKHYEENKESYSERAKIYRAINSQKGVL